MHVSWNGDGDVREVSAPSGSRVIKHALTAEAVRGAREERWCAYMHSIDLHEWRIHRPVNDAINVKRRLLWNANAPANKSTEVGGVSKKHSSLHGQKKKKRYTIVRLFWGSKSTFQDRTPCGEQPTARRHVRFARGATATIPTPRAKTLVTKFQLEKNQSLLAYTAGV